jgi:hypothetical protein
MLRKSRLRAVGSIGGSDMDNVSKGLLAGSFVLMLVAALVLLRPSANTTKAEPTPYPTIPYVDASENCESVAHQSFAARSAMTLCTFPNGLQCVAFSGGGVTCDWDQKGE